MHIHFLEKSVAFNSNDLNSNRVGGTEKCLINISNELAKDTNLKIKVFNNSNESITLNNVEWINIKEYSKYENPDVLISFSDMSISLMALEFHVLLSCLLSHSETEFCK